MASFTRISLALLTGTAALALAACDGADGVASPGGPVGVTPAPSPTPTPTPTPTAPAAIAAFAETAQSGITITRDEQLTVVNAGTNNVLSGVNPLNGFLPIGAAATATAFNASTINPFFVATSYIGAVNPAGDTWYQGWTCNSSTANFGSTSTACSSVPAVAAAATPAASACPAGTTAAGTNNNYRLCVLPAVVSGNLSLPAIAGIAYQMNGRVDVGIDTGGDGTAPGGAAATLTFAAGSLIVSNSSDAANDYLVVNRGSKLNAIGTATAPIIFTSQQNLNPASNGDATQGQWGGVILAGKAQISNCSSTGVAGGAANCQNVVEGTGNALYGGATAADNSGTLQYVQIRYSGIAISDGNELQGLTLGGTGSGTTLDHIQIHNSSDDGIEIFGGRSNLKYLALTGSDDDGLDTDVGWQGMVQFAIVAQKTIGATTDSFSTEIDSNGNEDFIPRQKGKLANFTFIQTANAAAAIRLRGGADYTFMNGIVKSVVPCINMIAGTDANGGKSTIRPAGGTGSVPTTIEEDGPPVFRSVYFACNNA
jgi:hypothetical protein